MNLSIFIIGEDFHIADLTGHIWKVDLHESGSLDPLCLCEVICGQGCMYGIRIGNIIFGGLGIQGQSDESSVSRFIH